MKIASKGYAQGDPMAVKRWPADVAFDVADFIRCQDEFEETRQVMMQRESARK